MLGPLGRLTVLLPILSLNGLRCFPKMETGTYCGSAFKLFIQPAQALKKAKLTQQAPAPVANPPKEPEAKEGTGVPVPAPKHRVTRAELELARLNTGSQISTPSDLEVGVWIGVKPLVFPKTCWSSKKKIAFFLCICFSFLHQARTLVVPPRPDEWKDIWKG